MKISVVIASYNYAQYIEEAINSVVNQKYQDWELIIVDDGSSDNSVEIIKNYCQKDSRIKFFQHENGQNKGLKETLLLGLSKTAGDWIAFLESDDSFSPDNLAKKNEIINKYPNVKLVFNKVEILSENPGRKKALEKSMEKLSKMQFPRNMFYDFYIVNKILTFSCVAVNADIIKNADFNTPVDALLDWWLWVHLAYKNQFYYIDEQLTNWRIHKESYINKSKKPVLYTVQTQAYKDVYKKNNKPFRLLIFIIYSNIKLLFFRSYRFCKRVIKNLKKF